MQALQQGDELAATMSRLDIGDDFAAVQIQRGENRQRAVAHVFVVARQRRLLPRFCVRQNLGLPRAVVTISQAGLRRRGRLRGVDLLVARGRRAGRSSRDRHLTTCSRTERSDVCCLHARQPEGIRRLRAVLGRTCFGSDLLLKAGAREVVPSPHREPPTTKICHRTRSLL